MISAKSDVQVDTPEVRVTEWRLAPGSATGHHIHEMDYVIVPVTSGEMTIVAPNGYCPFILPMSGRSWKSTTGIIHISAARSWCVAWSSERRANFLACKGRQASWYRSPVGCSIL